MSSDHMNDSRRAIKAICRRAQMRDLDSGIGDPLAIDDQP